MPMNEQEQQAPNGGQDIRQDPVIAGVLSRVPPAVAASFNEEQLLSLRAALGAHRGHRHPFDVRGTIGPRRWRWYYVFLAGRDQRRSQRPEGRCNRLALLIFWGAFLLLGLFLGLLLLAVLRWAFGVDLLGDNALLPAIERMLATLPAALPASAPGGLW